MKVCALSSDSMLWEHNLFFNSWSSRSRSCDHPLLPCFHTPHFAFCTFEHELGVSIWHGWEKATYEHILTYVGCRTHMDIFWHMLTPVCIWCWCQKYRHHSLSHVPATVGVHPARSRILSPSFHKGGGLHICYRVIVWGSKCTRFNVHTEREKVSLGSRQVLYFGCTGSRTKPVHF